MTEAQKAVVEAIAREYDAKKRAEAAKTTRERQLAQRDAIVAKSDYQKAINRIAR